MSKNGRTIPFFKRVNYQNLGRIREDDLLEKLKKENNALCIVNTKKQHR